MKTKLVDECRVRGGEGAVAWVAAAAAFCLAALGCKMEDPAAQVEAEKEIVRLMGREAQLIVQVEAAQGEAARLQVEVDRLEGELAKLAGQQPPDLERARAGLEKALNGLEAEVLRTRPGWVAANCFIGGLNGPSSEEPFSCEGFFELVSAAGERQRFEWRGLGSKDGTWRVFPALPSAPAQVRAVAPAGEPAAPVDPVQAEINRRIEEAKREGITIIETRDPERATIRPGR